MFFLASCQKEQEWLDAGKVSAPDRTTSADAVNGTDVDNSGTVSFDGEISTGDEGGGDDGITDDDDDEDEDDNGGITDDDDDEDEDDNGSGDRRRSVEG